LYLKSSGSFDYAQDDTAKMKLPRLFFQKTGEEGLPEQGEKEPARITTAKGYPRAEHVGRGVRET